MKNKIFNIRNTTFSLLSVLLAFATGCEEEVTDTTPPGVVSNIEFEPTNGGAIITYALPDDSDLLYVRAEYTNALGNKVFKSASRFTNTIEVDGFNDKSSTAHNIKLYTVDRSNNKSEAVDVQITANKSFIYLVQESLSLAADLGGVSVNWENPAAKTVFVYMYYNDGDNEYERILSSSSTSEELIMRGMEAISYDFSIVVEDFSGNKTDKVSIGTYKPLFEEKIDKSTWTLVPNLSVDANAWEGETTAFWDDVIDVNNIADDNSYFMISRDNNGGALNYPMDIVIDLNKQVKVNRFVVWQRAFDYENRTGDNVSDTYYYYKSENLRAFDLWASNDKQEWIKLGNFDIGDPRDADGNVPADKIQEAIDGHEFSLESTSEPFRYLKFSITANYGSEIYINGSEITLYGLDNVE